MAEPVEVIGTRLQFQVVVDASRNEINDAIVQDPDLAIEYDRACRGEENKFAVALARYLGYHPYETVDGVWIAEEGEYLREPKTLAWIRHFKQRFFDDLYRYGKKRSSKPSDLEVVPAYSKGETSSISIL